MRNADYAVHLMALNNTLLADLSDFAGLEYTRTFNAVGALSLRVPGFVRDIQRDQMITVYRSLRDQPQSLDTNTVWFINGFTYDDEDGVTIINAADTLSLIRRRLVAYPSNTDKATKTVDWRGYDMFADNLIKEFMAENMGPTQGDDETPGTVSDVNRVLSNIIIDAHLGQFPKAEKDAAWRNLLETITDIADEQAESGRRLLFDLVPEAGGIRFRFSTYDTYLGSDRRTTVQFGPDFGNLDAARLEIDWTEYVNYVYVGGDGQDDLRLIEEVADSVPLLSPWFRSEAFVDMRDEIDSAPMIAEGRAYINARRRKRTLSGEVVDGAPYVYGRDFFYGDYVRATMAGESFDAAIQSITVQVDREGERITVALGGDL